MTYAEFVKEYDRWRVQAENFFGRWARHVDEKYVWDGVTFEPGYVHIDTFHYDAACEHTLVIPADVFEDRSKWNAWIRTGGEK